MKFKNIKKKASAKGGSGKSQQSPSNSRTITESFRFSFPKLNSVMLLKIYRGTLKLFIALSFILAIAIVGLDLDANIREKKSIDLEREKLAQDLMFWESFIAEHKNYRDAYFQASILEYKLGDSPTAKKYVEKGLSLDPNSKEGRKIEEFLNK